MPKDKSTGKKLADMMYGNPEGAAFGITPMIGKRREDRQDREAAKSFPVDLARGVVAGAVGLPGDIESLARLPYELITGNESPTFLPTSEDVLKRIPFGTNTPAGQFASGLGTLAGGSANVGALPRAVKAAPGALKTAARNLSTPSTLNPQAGVIKMKGGNFLTGSVEGALKGLKKPMNPNEVQEVEAHFKKIEPFYDVNNPTEMRELAGMRQHIQALKADEALNNWVDRNLGNYVKKEMATPEDPVRRLAEEGITHMPQGEIDFANQFMPEQLAVKRMMAGFDPGDAGVSNAAKGWERITDEMLNVGTAGQHTRPLTPTEIRQGYKSTVDDNPWLTKLDPSTPVYYPENMDSMSRDLGFDHILDVLREDLTSGRIRPEQLNKVSMEQAVRRTYEYDQELAAKMNAERTAKRDGLPVYKEYPEGYRWVELNRPGAFASESEAMGHSVRGYEPPQGHPDWVAGSGDRGSLGYGHGGWEAIKSGKAKVYSLVDPKGNPHVTVEVDRSREPGWQEAKQAGGDPVAIQNEAKRRMGLDPDSPDDNREIVKNWDGDTRYAKQQELNRHFADIYREQFGDPPSQITQIKGKQNQAPGNEYLPFVQDFVRSGQWSGVGDLKNTGLIDTGGKYITQAEAKAEFDPRMQKAIEFLRTNPAFEEQRAARTRRDRDLFALDFDEQANLESTYGQPIYPGSGYSAVELLRILEDPGANASSLDNYYGDISRWVQEAEKAMKHYEPPPEGMARGGRVHFSDNPDVMALELAKGGAVAALKRLARAPAKSKQEIEAIAERLAPQVTGEYVRKDAKSAKTVAGKTQKQFQRERTLPVDVRSTGEERVPETVDIEKLKGDVMIGIPGDPTLTGKTLYGVGDFTLGSPSPQHGGPLYGLYNDDAFWASGIGPARGVQNLAKRASKQYDAPVKGNYIMMGPDSINYAQHFADANLQAIDLSRMTKDQVEKFNELIRKGSPKSGPRVSFPGIEDKGEAYLQMAMDPELRKHFNALMQMPTVTEPLNLPSGTDIRFAITEPALRDLETGVTGFSMGKMRPDVASKELPLSTHPTYDYDIPGEFMGQSRYPMPYELSFPDTLQSIRANPKQARQEFGSLKMVGPRQIIDQQMIDEIKAYEERMKQLTGKKAGGAVHKAAGGEITADDLILEERKL